MRVQPPQVFSLAARTTHAAGLVPSFRVPVRLGRPAHRNQEPTPRTHGAFPGSPGGTTAARSDLACATPASDLNLRCGGGTGPAGRVLGPPPALPLDQPSPSPGRPRGLRTFPTHR